MSRMYPSFSWRSLILCSYSGKTSRHSLRISKYGFWRLSALLPVVIYTIYGTFVAGYLGQQFSFRIFPNLWVDISNYSRWMGQIKDTARCSGIDSGVGGHSSCLRPVKAENGYWVCGWVMRSMVLHLPTISEPMIITSFL